MVSSVERDFHLTCGASSPLHKKTVRGSCCRLGRSSGFLLWWVAVASEGKELGPKPKAQSNDLPQQVGCPLLVRSGKQPEACLIKRLTEPLSHNSPTAMRAEAKQKRQENCGCEKSPVCVRPPTGFASCAKGFKASLLVEALPVAAFTACFE